MGLAEVSRGQQNSRRKLALEASAPMPFRCMGVNG
jgi:hypothetical protein